MLGPLVVVDDRICADFILATQEADATLCGACDGEGIIPERREDVFVAAAHRCTDCDGKGYVE